MGIVQIQKEQNNSLNEEISVRELITKLKFVFIKIKTKWKPLIAIFIMGSIFGVLFSIYEKPNFKAVLTFAMEDEKSGGGGALSGALGLASSFGIDLGGAGGGGAFAATNLSELMKSRLIVEKVLLGKIKINDKEISLIEYYINFSGLRKKWENNPKIRDIHFPANLDRNKFTLKQDSIFKVVHGLIIDKNKLTITQKDKKVTILSIEVVSENELFSKVFCERLAKETSDFYIETKSKKARINVEVLQRQVDSVRAELNHSINDVASEADNVYNLNPALNIKSTPSKKRQIDVQANTAILTNLVVQLELAKITLRKETPLIQIIDEPIFPLENDNIGIFKSFLFGGFLFLFLAILYLSFSYYFNINSQ